MKNNSNYNQTRKGNLRNMHIVLYFNRHHLLQKRQAQSNFRNRPTLTGKMGKTNVLR